MTETSALLVPIQVWALVLNGRQQTLRRWEMNYNNLRSYQTPQPAPFHSDIDDTFASQPQNQGVYLLWNLPAALRHGSRQAAGEIEFPPVPNRWLIVRNSGPLTKRSAMAWIVESDQVNSNTGDGSPHDTGSTYIDASGGLPGQTAIGRNRPLAGWSEPGESMIPLQAVAPGNMLFSAFQSTNNNIFSFHDNLTTQNITEGTLSYLVTGWYSDPQRDPLAAQGDFASILQGLHWTVQASGQSATRSLYHGSINSLTWKQGTDPIPSPRDTAETDVTVSVGYSGIDALTALVAQQLSAEKSSLDALLLEAFHYGLLGELDQPGGRGILEERLREKWYGFSSREIAWEIVDATSSGPTPPDPPSETEIRVEKQWLSDLNQAQIALEQAQTTLRGLQRQLYELWWKRGYATWRRNTFGKWPFGTDQQQFDAAFDPDGAHSLVSRVNAQLNQVQSLLARVPHPTSDLSFEQAVERFAQDHKLSSKRRLKANARPRSWHANDPTILLSGVNHVKVDDYQSTLPCRWPEQIVSSILYKNAPLSLDQIRDLIPVPDGWEHVPFAETAITALLDEFFLLDPANAASIAEAVFHTSDPAFISDLQKHMGAQSMPAGKTLLPFFGLEPWEQAWIPLFLEWQVTWYPLPFQQQGRDLWTFDGLEYQFQQSIPQPSPQTLTGRSLLTLQAQNTFKKQLEDFIKHHPDETLLAQLDAFIAQMDQWDFLSQVMEGFTTQIALRNPFAMLSPDSQTALFQDTQRSLADLIGAEHFSIPLSIEETPADPWNVGDSTFEGLRAGQFVFEQLSLVDRFGQLIEVITSNNAQTFDRLVIADGLQPTNPVLQVQSERVVQLPPRLLQEGQLRFDFVAANGNPPQPLAPGSATNPIIGWLIPNHLDKALAVYTPGGMYLGEMYVAVDESGQRSVHWEQAPRSAFTLAAIASENEQLGAFLNHLQQKDADTFFAFLSVIDETLWTIDQPRTYTDQKLAVLAGRPLALVRASLQFHLAMDALTDPRWPDTFKDNPKNPLFLYDEYPFPVRLGSQLDRSDGLIGYFLNGDYDAFNTVHMPEGAQASKSSYLAPMGPNNFIPLSFAASSTALVTMLIDPRAGVHASSGLFPALRLDLPVDFTRDALKNLQVAFHAGALLGHLQTSLDAHTGATSINIQVPRPAEQGGTWSWLQLQHNTWNEYGLTPADQIARLRDDLPVLRDGLFVFKNALSEADSRRRKP